MLYKKTYVFSRWTAWPDELNAAAQDFFAKFDIYPNIMLANENTYQKIDMVASQEEEKTLDAEGRPPDTGEYINLASFVGNDYEIDFCLENEIDDKTFVLIHDSDPGGGGEEIPDEDSDDFLDVELIKKAV